MQKVLKELFDQFVKKNGREPNNLEMILIRQKASAEEIRKRKIINMFDRSPVDADKPILGGQNIEETDTQILERLNKGNKESISNMKYENAVKAEEAKAAADEDYIMKVLDPEDFSKGGRAGYYGGGQAMVGEDLSQIGHGADALMARNMQLAPNSMATTSTGLNYLLGEDNDTVRVPYSDGKNFEMYLREREGIEKKQNKERLYREYKEDMRRKKVMDSKQMAAEGGRIGYNEGKMVLPKPKPNADPMVELLRVYNLYQESMPGVSQDTKKYLQQDFIQKLNDAGISQEAFMTNRMQNNLADGGPARKGFKGGGSDASTTSFSESFDRQHGTNTAANANKTVDAQQAAGQRDADKTNDIIAANQRATRSQQIPNNKTLGQKIGYGVESFFNNPFVRTYATIGTGGFSEKLRQMMMAKKAYDNRDIFQDEIIEDEIDNIPITGGITTNYAEGGPARQNFKMGKRAFLKLMGGVGAGIASLKTGLLGFGKEGGKKVAKEVVKEATGAPPAYFFKLVDKIRKLGDDAPKLAIKDKENVTTYKDYTLTEDITTGETTIQRMKIDDDLKYDASEYYGKPVGEEVYMSYKPGKSQMDETTKGKTPPDEYTEDTSLIRGDKPAEGEVMDTFDGVPDDLLEEVGETIVKKANGGRIGYAGGKKVAEEVIKKVNKKLGKKSVTTADKIDIPKETLLRDMFTDTNKRLNKKREMTVDEYEDFVEEVGGADQLEAYNFDGTVGDAERILKEQENNMAYMYEQYKMGKLDPVAGDKSPARKRFLEKKMEESLMSGDSKLMTREEIDELYNFDLGTEMEAAKKASKIDDDIDISQGMIDLDEMNFTKNAQAAKNKMDNMDVNQKIKEGVASIMSDTSPAALQKSIEIDNLMLKYPGMDNALAEQIATSEPIKKADLIAMVEQTFKLSEQGKSGDEIIEIFKNTTRTKQATGGLASILG